MDICSLGATYFVAREDYTQSQNMNPKATQPAQLDPIRSDDLVSPKKTRPISVRLTSHCFLKDTHTIAMYAIAAVVEDFFLPRIGSISKPSFVCKHTLSLPCRVRWPADLWNGGRFFNKLREAAWLLSWAQPVVYYYPSLGEGLALSCVVEKFVEAQ